MSTSAPLSAWVFGAGALGDDLPDRHRVAVLGDGPHREARPRRARRGRGLGHARPRAAPFTWPAPLDTSRVTVEPWSAWATAHRELAEDLAVGYLAVGLGTTVTLKPSASSAARATSTCLRRSRPAPLLQRSSCDRAGWPGTAGRRPAPPARPAAPTGRWRCASWPAVCWPRRTVPVGGPRRRHGGDGLGAHAAAPAAARRPPGAGQPGRQGGLRAQGRHRQALEVVAQVGPQVLGRGVALGRVLGHELGHDGLEGGRDGHAGGAGQRGAAPARACRRWPPACRPVKGGRVVSIS